MVLMAFRLYNTVVMVEPRNQYSAPDRGQTPRPAGRIPNVPRRRFIDGVVSRTPPPLPPAPTPPAPEPVASTLPSPVPHNPHVAVSNPNPESTTVPVHHPVASHHSPMSDFRPAPKVVHADPAASQHLLDAPEPEPLLPAHTPAPTSSSQLPEKSRRTLHMPTLSKNILRGILSLAVFVAVVFGAATALNSFVFQSYYVDGLSMTPTLENNDRLLISKVERTQSQMQQHAYLPNRGQIVVLDSSVSPLTAAKGEQLIKRVIGLPGDKIQIREGRVIIVNKENPGGFIVDDSLGLNLSPTYVENDFASYSVPDGSVFVMGDNRGAGGSYDSRAFGPVTSDKILGRLWLRILPLTKTGVF
jgi:signal peptidase I